MLNIKELDKKQLQRANNVSFNNDRRDIRESTYKEYIYEVLKWDVSENKKQKILDELYRKNSEILNHEANFVSVIVAGPAKYNKEKEDKEADKILDLSRILDVWFNELKYQYKLFNKPNKEESSKKKVEEILKLHDMGADIKKELIELAYIDNNKFIELCEKFYHEYCWRKNSIIYKVYLASKEGKVKEFEKKIIFEDENFTAYLKNDRVFIKFVFKPQAQLKFVLKKKGYWWNSREKSWSTYPSRLDMEWVKSISSKYEKYL